MNINQLLVITFLLLLYTLSRKNYENFQGQITKEICVQRMLNNECNDPEKKEKINRDCGEFELIIPSGKVNISCDNQLLFNTLLCNKMISDGACECAYGRKQVSGLCNTTPLNITCPEELRSKDVAIIRKIRNLRYKCEKCKDIEFKEKKLARYALQLKNIIMKSGLNSDSTDYHTIIYGILVIIILGGITFFYYKKK
tara:strand:+ start:755 stop:1348 length:594 start_codon:yes stop_codon:yes gene_type:complete